MTRYFFQCEGYENFRDETGTELPDLAAAKSQCIQMVGEILRNHADDFTDHPAWRVFVLDSAKQPLFELNVSAKDH